MIIYPGSSIYDENQLEYEVKKFIGNGSFGDVYKITKKDSNEIFALKTIHASFPSHNILKSFINEGNLALGISHENIIKYIYFHDGSVQNTLPPYIIMEYAEQGSLQERIDNRSSSKNYFNNDELNVIFRLFSTTPVFEVDGCFCLLRELEISFQFWYRSAVFFSIIRIINCDKIGEID